VGRLLDVPAYVLRFWETEFPQLKPNKGGTGQRLYRRKDVETAMRIKGLLYDQGYTIPGARQALRSDAPDTTEKSVILSEARSAESKDPAACFKPPMLPATLSTTNPRAPHALRDELRSLCAQLSQSSWRVRRQPPKNQK
jgi:DNA-binding transcriptional MerR regulator